MVVMEVALVSCHQPWGCWLLGGIRGGGGGKGLFWFHVIFLLILLLGQLGVGIRSIELESVSGFMGGRDLIMCSARCDSEVWSQNIQTFFLLIKVISL